MPAAGAPTAVPASMPTSSRTASAAAGVHTRVPGAWAFRAAPAPDLVRRAVSGISRTNHVWVADTTAIRSGEGWLHRAVVIDLRSRRVVGWKASATLDASLTGNAVRMALHRRRPVAGRERVHHSDRGSTSTAWAFQALLRKAGITCSMGRPGTCMDKPVAETFFATLRGRAHPPAPLDFTCRCGQSHIRLCRNVAQPAPSARKPRLPQPRCLRSLPTVCPDRSQTIDCPINGCKSNRGVARWWDTAGVAWMMAMPPGRRRLLAPGSAEAVAERIVPREGRAPDPGHQAAVRPHGGAVPGSGEERFAPGDTVRAGKPLDGTAHPGGRVGCLPPACATHATTAGLDDARNPVPDRNRRLRTLHGPRFPVTCLALDANRAWCSPSLSDWTDHFFGRRECPRGGDGDGSESERREACPRTPKEVS